MVIYIGKAPDPNHLYQLRAEFVHFSDVDTMVGNIPAKVMDINILMSESILWLSTDEVRLVDLMCRRSIQLNLVSSLTIIRPGMDFSSLCYCMAPSFATACPKHKET